MKNFAILILICLFSVTAYAQKPTPKAIKKPAVVKTGNETEEFEKAIAVASAPERIAALQKFLTSFPKSERKNRVLELIVSARAEIAEQKLTLNETEEGVKLFILAAAEAPKPISEELFAKVILQLPTNLFLRSQPKAALEVAKLIEEKAEGNSKQLLALGTFYLGVENGDEAKRLAEKVLTIDAASLPVESQIGAYQMVGMANRLNFDLEAAAQAYAKALELNPNSTVSRRSLAEMKRATGKTDEAAALYREILEKDAADNTAQTGLILSLFDAGKQTEAETELAKSLEANPNNLFLLVGAAYWYVAHAQADKAVDYAQRAVGVEPRYTWGQIALARALMLQRKPLEAEKALLTARQYGNFPTLVYELASVRLAAGFYFEAADELKKGFAVRNGVIYANLGNRVPKNAQSFTELLAPERRASIFEMNAADNPENAEKLKSLLTFSLKLNAKEPSETEIVEAAEEFVKGEDNAKTHRQIYAASRLLFKKMALPKVLEMMQGAVKGVDSSLDVDSPSSSVLADELFETRLSAIERGQLVIVPNLPRQTLLNILRGRIEEIAGWTLYQQEKPQEAGIRLKRAVGILPEKSTWWRSSWWRLGASLEASGKPSEALDAYIKSYTNGEPDAAKRTVIEVLYQKINGTTEGLDEKIGAKPKPSVSFLIKQPDATETQARVEPSPTPVAVNQIAPNPTPSTAIETTSKIDETTKVSETTQAKVEPSPSTVRVVVTNNLPPTEATPAPTVEATPTSTPTPEMTSTPETKPSPTPESKTAPDTNGEPAPETTAKVENPKVETPKVEPSPVSVSESKPEPTPLEVKPEKIIVSVTDPLEKKTTETRSSTDEKKPLFDPVVINVPKTETVKPKIEPAEEKPAATPKIEEPKPETQAKNTDEKSNVPDPLTTGEQRVRVIVTDNLPSGENSSCSLLVGQNSISLLNNGGNLGVMVGYSADDGDLSKITAVSSSPEDIGVTLEPEIGKQSKRAFFIVKSISPKTGIFTVTFDSPCGKKEVQVKVR
jgi:Tfp pilus assembly protein PilF